jgi:autotransporter translocation and assembly factor TamB
MITTGLKAIYRLTGLLGRLLVQLSVILSLGLLLLLIIAYGLLNFNGDQVVDYALKKALPKDYVQWSKITGKSINHLTFHDVTLYASDKINISTSDETNRTKPLAKIKALNLKWSVWKLLFGRLHIQNINANHVMIPPHTFDKVDKPLRLNLNGSLRYSLYQHVAQGQIKAVDPDHELSSFMTVTFDYDPFDNYANLTLLSKDRAKGILYYLNILPKESESTINIQGSGPLSHLPISLDVNLSTHGALTASGVLQAKKKSLDFDTKATLSYGPLLKKWQSTDYALDKNWLKNSATTQGITKVKLSFPQDPDMVLEKDILWHLKGQFANKQLLISSATVKNTAFEIKGSGLYHLQNKNFATDMQVHSHKDCTLHITQSTKKQKDATTKSTKTQQTDYHLKAPSFYKVTGKGTIYNFNLNHTLSLTEGSAHNTTFSQLNLAASTSRKGQNPGQNKLKKWLKQNKPQKTPMAPLETKLTLKLGAIHYGDTFTEKDLCLTSNIASHLDTQQHTVSAFNLTHPGYTITGNGSLQNNQIKGTISHHINLDKLATYDHWVDRLGPVRGQTKGEGTISGALNNPQVDYNLDLSTLKNIPADITDWSMRLTLDQLNSTPTLRHTNKGIFNGVAFTTTGDVRVPPGQPLAFSFLVQHQNNKLSFAGTHTPDQTHITLLPTQIHNFHTYFPQATSLTNNTTHNLIIHKADINFSVQKGLDAHIDMAADHLPLGPALFNQAHFIYSTNHNQPTLSFIAKEFYLNKIMRPHFQVKATHDASLQNISWAIDYGQNNKKTDYGHFNGTTRFTNALLSKKNPLPLTFTLKKATGFAQKHPFQLTKPAVFTYAAPKDFALNPFMFMIGQDGQISGHLDTKKTKGTIKLHKIPLDLLGVPLNYPQNLDGTFSLSGTPAKPHLGLDFAIHKFSFSHPNERALNIQFKSRLTPTFLEGDLIINSNKSTSFVPSPITNQKNFDDGFVFHARLPIGSTPDLWRPQLFDNGLLKGHIKGDLDLSRLMAVVPLGEDVIKGLLSINGTLKGTLLNPKLNLSGGLKKGYFENDDIGIIAGDINCTFNGNESQLNIQNLNATDGEKGTLSGQGRIHLLGAYPYQISSTLTDFAAFRQEDSRINVSGTLDFTGQAGDNGLLKANINVTDGTYSIPTQSSTPIPEISVIDPDAPKSQKTLLKGRAYSGINLDVSAKTPKTLKIKGWGITGTVEGALAITGPIEQPKINGRLRAVPGTGSFDFLGPKFTVEKAVALFNGRDDHLPHIDAIAAIVIKEPSQMTAQLLLTGYVNDLKFAFNAQPHYEQNEIISRIFFKKNLKDLSYFEMIKLGRIAGRFRNGGKNPLAFFEQIQSKLGIEDIDFELHDENSPEAGQLKTLRVGARVFDRVKIVVEEDFEARRTGGKVALDLPNNITLESGLGSDGSGAFGGSWRVEY